MPPPHVHTVLLVDDDDDVRGTFALGLATRRIVVHGAASALEALALADRGLRPCVVLLDLRMPQVDGWEALRLLRR